MGCFFGCFRSKDSNLKAVNPPQEPVVSGSKNALSSLFMCDDEPIGKGDGQKNFLPQELDIKELKEEAKFLKACGTLPETPVEIRKALEKWEGKSYSLGDSPSSCITDGLNPRRDTKNSITPVHMPDSDTHSESSAVSQPVLTPNAQGKTKSVRFECDTESSAYSSKGSSEFLTQPHKQFGSARNGSVPKPSPYPTPLKVPDEVHTPDTEFLAFSDAGKITKARSQYVQSVLSQAEGPSELKDGCSDFNDDSNMPNPQKEDDMMSTPVAEPAAKHIAVEKEPKIEASLSDWLKPVSHTKSSGIEKFRPVTKGYFPKASVDRPILGMVAAHWNEEETSDVPTKWWDGNGIPNSTNKYKEDQKVSWHATPFEERLEKALSEETFTSKRKPFGMTTAFDLDEPEESDTAFSHMQSPDCIKPVVSF